MVLQGNVKIQWDDVYQVLSQIPEWPEILSSYNIEQTYAMPIL